MFHVPVVGYAVLVQYVVLGHVSAVAGSNFTPLIAQPITLPFGVVLASAGTRIGREVRVVGQLVPPLTAQVAVCPVSAEAPLPVGAREATLALPFPAMTAPIVGAPGTVRGVPDTVPDEARVPAA